MIVMETDTKDGTGSVPRIRVTRMVKHVLTSTYDENFYPGMTLAEAIKWETEQPLEEILEYILDGTSEMVSATVETIEDTEDTDSAEDTKDAEDNEKLF